MLNKRTVPQAVFDSKEALRAASQGHLEACNYLESKHPTELGIGNPNHPFYDGIFGYDKDEFLSKQYR